MAIQDMDRHNPAKMLARREKLKCLIAYLKHTVKDERLLRGSIRLQRTRNTDTDFMDYYRMER